MIFGSAGYSLIYTTGQKGKYKQIRKHRPQAILRAQGNEDRIFIADEDPYCDKKLILSPPMSDQYTRKQIILCDKQEKILLDIYEKNACYHSVQNLSSSSLLSTNFSRNISNFKNNSAKYFHKCTKTVT
jgi:hypothetical protein